MKRLLGLMSGRNRPILIPSVPVSEGIEIRHGCQFISSLVRALAKAAWFFLAGFCLVGLALVCPD